MSNGIGQVKQKGTRIIILKYCSFNRKIKKEEISYNKLNKLLIKNYGLIVNKIFGIK